MPPAFYPFVIEIEHNGEYVEVMQDWQGNPRAYLYGTVTRAEMLMSQAEIDQMYETIEEEAEHYEPDWSLRNRSIAEMCRLESERPAVPHQIAAE
jgi:hypothetical protein